MRIFPLLGTLVLLVGVGGMTGCKRSNQATASQRDAIKAPENRRKVAPRKRFLPPKHVVLFLGDSLTAGYGVSKQEAYPSLINDYWRKHKHPWRTKNAGVSGDTTAGVLRRLGWVLTSRVHTVFLCIGANDGLRGLALGATEKNLHKIVSLIQKRGIRVVIAGMMLPPNYGKEYTERFRKMYVTLATTKKLKRMPFLLKDVAGKPKLNIADGIHPNTKGHKILANNVLAFFKANQLFQK
jgi:acyl-CoA thioesterase-1